MSLLTPDVGDYVIQIVGVDSVEEFEEKSGEIKEGTILKQFRTCGMVGQLLWITVNQAQQVTTALVVWGPPRAVRSG
eukprot:11718579-Karenia_brevis.AAC.1